MQATIKIFLRNKLDLNNQKPVVLRITKSRKSKVITLGLKSEDTYWDFELNRYNKKAKNYIKKNRALLKLEEKALIILDDYIHADEDFTLAQFENRFRGIENKPSTVYTYMKKMINELDENEKYSSSAPFKNLESAIFKFSNKKLKFKEIDFNFLKNFESYLRSQKNTDGGIAFKMRHLRTLFNNAINEDIIDFSKYPFKKYKISKLKGESNKIALSEVDLRKFENVNLSKDPHLITSHKIFMFSFFCRGINWTDMMNLRWSDIYDEKIHYVRKKTKQNFVIEISPSIRETLEYFRTIFIKTDYVFPILLTEGLTVKQKMNRSQRTLKKFNKELNEIGRLANISKPITSYVARHTYATYMYNNGVSIEIISASMGHSSVLVTMSYLKEFEDSVLDEANKILFKEPEPLYA